MGRDKHVHCWKHVTRVENGRKWICKYCTRTFSGGATTIKTHLGIQRKGSGRCSVYCANEELRNNMASTSTNPQVVSAQVQGENPSSLNVSDSESEIKRLKEVVQDLECEKKYITKQLMGKKGKPDVHDWLEELQDLRKTADGLNNSDDSYDISELVKQLKRHKEDVPLTLSTELVGESLDMNIQQVLNLLADDDVFLIGIYGMGGVGKTLLATLVESEIKRKGHNVVWVSISQNFSISKLQDDIAKRIGVTLDKDDEKIRADKLASALKEKTVLILDDVWKYIDFRKVGIQPKVNGIKLILTTRLKHMCQQMDCLPDHMIPIMPLSSYDDNEGDESWKLFMEKLGRPEGTARTLPREVNNIARCIVMRCEGLPLGINVVARIMKGIDDIHQWRYTLKFFEKGQELVEEAFKVLKRSFDNLTERGLQYS